MIALPGRVQRLEAVHAQQQAAILAHLRELARALTPKDCAEVRAEFDRHLSGEISLDEFKRKFAAKLEAANGLK